MGDASLSVLASSQVVAEGGNNFLVPNGTFFFVLAIFLIVLAVIGTFVVPPVMKVLRERDAMVAKTARQPEGGRAVRGRPGRLRRSHDRSPGAGVVVTRQRPRRGP